MNIVTLIGNLTTGVKFEGEVEGSARAEFSLAIQRPDKTNDVIKIVVTGAQAETCSMYIEEGSRIALDGRIRSDEDGTYVIANRIQFLSRSQG